MRDQQEDEYFYYNMVTKKVGKRPLSAELHHWLKYRCQHTVIAGFGTQISWYVTRHKVDGSDQFTTSINEVDLPAPIKLLAILDS